MKNLRLLITGIITILTSTLLTSCSNEPTTRGATETQHLISMVWECRGNKLHMRIINASGNESIGTQVLLNDEVITSTDTYPYEDDYVIPYIGEQWLQIYTGTQYTIENGQVVFTGGYQRSSISKFMMNTSDN